MQIRIGNPYIIKKKDGETALCADIEGCGEAFTLWYSVAEEYSQYLCTERSDAFLIALLSWAMMRSSESEPVNIISDVPVSEQLYHQITQYYIPVLTSNISYFSPVKITAYVTAEVLPCSNAVGTGISGGVDSSYTVAKYLNCENPSYRLTHGVYFNMGMYGGMDSTSELALQRKVLTITEQTGLKLLKVTSNTCVQLYGKAHAPIVPSVFSGTVLALQKLFSVYYYSSGFTAADFEMNEADAAYYDLLNVHCFTTPNTTFYSSGVEATRMEKVKFITNAAFTYKNLSVCLSVDQTKGNCGRCAKCTRTMAELEVIGKLDLYSDVFDVQAFRADPGYHWGYVLLKSRNDLFCREILEKYRAAGHRLSPRVYWACLKKWVARGFTSQNRKREKVENI